MCDLDVCNCFVFLKKEGENAAVTSGYTLKKKT